MPNLRIGKPLGAIVLMFAALAGAGGQPHAAQCKRKTAGFYLQDMGADAPHKLALTLRSIAQPLTSTPGDPERGREVLVSHQKGDCLSCHKLSLLSSIRGQGEIGPALDGAGSKYDAPQLRQLIADPKVYFPGTIMPSYYTAVGSPPGMVLTATEIEDLVAYLRTLK